MTFSLWRIAPHQNIVPLLSRRQAASPKCPYSMQIAYWIVGADNSCWIRECIPLLKQDIQHWTSLLSQSLCCAPLVPCIRLHHCPFGTPIGGNLFACVAKIFQYALVCGVPYTSTRHCHAFAATLTTSTSTAFAVNQVFCVLHCSARNERSH